MSKNSKNKLTTKQEQIRIRDKEDVCRDILKEVIEASEGKLSLTDLVLSGAMLAKRGLAKRKALGESAKFIDELKGFSKQIKAEAKFRQLSKS